MQGQASSGQSGRKTTCTAADGWRYGPLDMALWRSWMKDLMDGKGVGGYGLDAVFKGNTCRGLRVSGSAI